MGRRKLGGSDSAGTPSLSSPIQQSRNVAAGSATHSYALSIHLHPSCLSQTLLVSKQVVTPIHLKKSTKALTNKSMVSWCSELGCMWYEVHHHTEKADPGMGAQEFL